MQLLFTEKVVSEAVDGFHRAQNVYGGRVLNALRNNAMKNKKDAAAKLDAPSFRTKETLDRSGNSGARSTHPSRKRDAPADVSSRLCGKRQRAGMRKD